MGPRAYLTAIADTLEGQRTKIVPFAILMGIFLAFYLGEMSTFTLSIDEEFAATRPDPAAWLGQGRWMLFLLEAAMPQPALPYFPLFFFGLCCSAGYIMLTDAFRIGLSGVTPYFLFPLFCGFPTLFFILDFSANMPGVAVGILACCGAVLSFSTTAEAWADGAPQGANRMIHAAGQIVLAAVAIGCYETFALFILFGCAAVFINIATNSGRPPPPRFALSIHFYALAVLVAALVLSWSATQILAQMQGVRLSNYTMALIRLDVLRDDPVGVIGKSLSAYSKVYSGSSGVYGFTYYNFVGVPIVGAIAILGRSRRGAAWQSLVIGYLLAMTFIPFLLHMVGGGWLPYRTIVAVQFVFWFFAAVAATSGFRTLRWLALGLSVVVSLQSLYTFSAFQAGKRLVYQHDVLLASRIYDRIAEMAPSFDRKQLYFIDVYGATGFQSFYPEVPSSTWSASFFEWDGGNVPRMTTFMRILGYTNVRTMGAKDRQQYLAEMLEMPVWPDRGSVRVHGDKVLVKLGDSPGYSHRGLEVLVQ
jgi:hypothetical protein